MSTLWERPAPAIWLQFRLSTVWGAPSSVCEISMVKSDLTTIHKTNPLFRLAYDIII